MRQAFLLLATALAASATLLAPAAAQNRGLTAPVDALSQAFSTARWQARLERDAPTTTSLRELGPASPLATVPTSLTQTLRLMGDYQLEALRLGQTGGLRLTGGLLINLRGTSTLAANDAGPTLPYAGIGYASGNLAGSWGISADLGLTAAGLGLSLGNRNGLLGLGMDGGLRDLRLQPMLRLGMNLAF